MLPIKRKEKNVNQPIRTLSGDSLKKEARGIAEMNCQAQRREI